MNDSSSGAARAGSSHVSFAALRQTSAELSDSLRQYLYAKYVYRPHSDVEPVAREPVHLAVSNDQPELMKGERR